VAAAGSFREVMRGPLAVSIELDALLAGIRRSNRTGTRADAESGKHLRSGDVIRPRGSATALTAGLDQAATERLGLGWVVITASSP